LEPRPFQVETARAALDGKSIILRKMTGAGKTMAFVVAYICRKRKLAANFEYKSTLVIISPLKSIMQSQQKSFQKRFGPNTDFNITSGVLGEVDFDGKIWEAFKKGQIEPMWVSPAIHFFLICS
jgi:superfamily II DNA/RNA helicase